MSTSVLHLHLLDLPGEEQGSFGHRVVNALRLLSGDPRFAPAQISWLAPDALRLALAADILVIHALAGIEIEALIRHRRRAGRVTLFEIGDELSSPRPWRRREPEPRNPLIIARQLLHASLADGIQFSAAALSRMYAELNPRSVVLENAVHFPPQQPYKPPGFVFGWAGTRSHKEDLAALAPCITAFCGRHRDAVFALMGDAELHCLFAALPPEQFIAKPFGSYAEYRSFLGSLHIGIVPLISTAFNSGRSDVKIVEMAAEGAAVLAQDALAYQDCRDAIQVFDSAEALSALLERLYSDRDELTAIANAGWTKLSLRRGETVTLSRHSAWYAAWGVAAGPSLPSISADAAALSLRLDEAQQLARAGDDHSALRKGQRLLESRPDYVQARWLVAALLSRLGANRDALEAGAALAACPIFGNLWFALAANLCNDPSLRRNIIIPELRLNPAGLTPEALTEYHQQLLIAHPFHFFALAAERRRLEQHGDIRQASVLRRRLELINSRAAGLTDEALSAS